MRNLLLLLLATAFANGLHAQEGARITFEKEFHDFGVFDEGENPTFVFKFTNSGDAPLVITRIDKQCGCTDPKFSREPVLPGATGSIEVSYLSQGRPGSFHRTLTVHTNNQQSKAIHLKGEVKRKATTDF